MNVLKWVGAGLAGGIVGAAVWAGISYGLNAEVGWIAWGIGGLVGVCVRLGADAQDEGTLTGVGAAIIAIASVLLGKYLAVYVAVAGIGDITIPEVTADQMVVRFADEIVEARQAQGKPVVFNNGKTEKTAEVQADYPADVWQEAQARWNAIPPDQQTTRLADENQKLRDLLGNLQGQVRHAGFMASFTPYDILWFILAAATAFRIGFGGREE